MGGKPSVPAANVIAADQAIAAGDFTALKKCFESYSATAYCFGDKRWNLLHLACWYDQPALLRELISRLSSAENHQMQSAEDANSETPVQLAHAEGATECARLLREGSSQLTSHRETGSMHLIAKIGSQEMPDDDVAIPQRPKSSFQKV